jgi:hypothetical protein
MGLASKTAGAIGMPTWVRSLPDSSTNHFLDLNSIQRFGPTVLASVLVNGPVNGLELGRSSVYVMTFDCARRTRKILSLRVMAEVDGLGMVIAEPAVSGKDEQVELLTAEDQDLNAACNASMGLPGSAK